IPKDAIGVIEIESLDIRYPIYEGATEAQLSRGIGHLPETAGLLEQGNCVLCGHNGSSRGLFFTTLSHIRKDEQVKITMKDKRSRIYCVKSTRVVSPHDPSVRKKSDDEILTLFTCAYHGTRRFVAECVPDEDEVTPMTSPDAGDM
ncbi:MAG: class D sortase, partial [Eubacterium sp.]|nr:class D sortase [Eubacterium sp.]